MIPKIVTRIILLQKNCGKTSSPYTHYEAAVAKEILTNEHLHGSEVLWELKMKLIKHPNIESNQFRNKCCSVKKETDMKLRLESKVQGCKVQKIFKFR